MPDPGDAIALVGLLLIGTWVFGWAVADAVRDSDWWVILRGRTVGKRDRFLRFVRRAGRG